MFTCMHVDTAYAYDQSPDNHKQLCRQLPWTRMLSWQGCRTRPALSRQVGLSLLVPCWPAQETRPNAKCLWTETQTPSRSWAEHHRSLLCSLTRIQVTYPAIYNATVQCECSVQFDACGQLQTCLSSSSQESKSSTSQPIKVVHALLLSVCKLACNSHIQQHVFNSGLGLISSL